MTSALNIVDGAFRSGELSPAQLRVTRLLVNLSERCQLRCAHCITDAPRKTLDGSARDLSRAVLDALAPHLADVAYVGLVHAGEPMLAPLFEPFLEELARRRRGPGVVHLLSNGMAMTAERFARCIARGVTSFSFSLDGMSAASNDVLRIGSRVELLTERIGALASSPSKRASGARLGIAWVVTRANVSELEALVRWAAGAGVDWVKLEELYVDGVVVGAPMRALAVDRYALDVAVARARALGAELGVAVLDHTRPLEVWKCRMALDTRMATRSRLDDVVNRCEINPCRMPWELACIEPDGDVKPMSFHHPVAGNVLSTPLDEIFRAGASFIDQRRQTLAGRLCGAGADAADCSSDPGPSAW